MPRALPEISRAELSAVVRAVRARPCRDKHLRAAAGAFAAILLIFLHSASVAAWNPSQVPVGAQEENQMLSLRQIAVVSSLAVSSSTLAQNAVQWRVEDGGNGHWYRIVSSGQTFQNAKTQAESMGGHLATITSAGEQQFIAASVASGTNFLNAWIGLAQDPGSAEPAGGWRWVTGEALGPYSNWWMGVPQPDNSACGTGVAEDFVMWAKQWGGFWADVSGGTVPGAPCTGEQSHAIVEWSADCNNDGVVDYGQIHTGELADTNANNIPDCCETGSPCSANILVNGSFELGDAQSCGWVCMGTGDLRLVGWNVVLNSVDRQRTEPDGCNEGWFASHGNYSVDLNGCSVGGIIRQVAPTQVGETYRLSFDLTLNAANVEIGRLRVRAGEAVHDFEYQRRPTNPQPSEHHEFEFDAMSGATAIEFESLNREYPEQWNGPVVDAIRLEQVINPCPADVDGSGAVNGVDLAAILNVWGTSGGKYPGADVNHDGIVDGADLSEVLNGWGACP